MVQIIFQSFTFTDFTVWSAHLSFRVEVALIIDELGVDLSIYEGV